MSLFWTRNVKFNALYCTAAGTITDFDEMARKFPVCLLVALLMTLGPSYVDSKSANRERFIRSRTNCMQWARWNKFFQLHTWMQCSGVYTCTYMYLWAQVHDTILWRIRRAVGDISVFEPPAPKGAFSCFEVTAKVYSNGEADTNCGEAECESYFTNCARRVVHVQICACVVWKHAWFAHIFVYKGATEKHRAYYCVCVCMFMLWLYLRQCYINT